jgi:hypothetical protein
MIKNAIIFLFFLLCIPIMAQEDKMNSLNKLIDEVKNEFAPDKRVAVFQIDISTDSGKIILNGETNLFKAKEKLINGLNSLHFEYVDKIAILPSSDLEDKIYGLVNLSVANIRTLPDHPEELSTQALLGTPLKILKKDSGFYLVQTPDDYISWVDDAGITPITKLQLNEWVNSQKIIYLKEYEFSYLSADNSSDRISDLTAGNILVKLGEENNFIKVKYPDDRIAFIEKDYCKNYNDWLAESKPTGSDIVSTARKFMGVPYLWGGTSAKGMDCSGFTKTVYYLNGIVLSRDASQQVNTGVLIDTQNGFENLVAGDLLFFGSRETETKKERITHVGIYIGNYEFIHAAGRVKINSFNKDADNFSNYRYNGFIRAKRILGTVDEAGVTSLLKNKYYNGQL